MKFKCLSNLSVFAGLIAVGCSSTPALLTPTEDASINDSTADVYVPPRKETGTDSGKDSAADSGNLFELGKECSKNTQCTPEICNSTSEDNPDPTPTCTLKDNTCDPTATPDEVLNCADGQGICLEGASKTEGICTAPCLFKPDGTPEVACAGKNWCNFLGYFGTNGSKAYPSIGFCEGGCTKDTDCSGGKTCLKEFGWCLDGPITYPKQPGNACQRKTTDTTRNQECRCAGLQPASGKPSSGFCTKSCYFRKVDDPAATDNCPTDFVCDDPELTRTIQLSTNTGPKNFTIDVVPEGLSGTCFPSCTVDADCETKFPNSNLRCRSGQASGKKFCYPERPTTTDAGTDSTTNDSTAADTLSPDTSASD